VVTSGGEVREIEDGIPRTRLPPAISSLTRDGEKEKRRRICLAHYSLRVPLFPFEVRSCREERGKSAEKTVVAPRWKEYDDDVE